MIGSTSAHEAMNGRMAAVLGSEAEARMHQVLGARFVGCTGPGGQGMMDSGSGLRAWSQDDWSAMMGPGGWGSMMGTGAWTQMMGNASDWSWMTGARWRAMSAADWQTVQQRLLGNASGQGTDSGWHARDVVLLLLVVALAAGLVGLLLVRRPWRRAS